MEGAGLPRDAGVSTRPRVTTAVRYVQLAKEWELSVLDLVLLAIAGLVAFTVLYVVGLITLRVGGGDDIKDIGLD